MNVLNKPAFLIDFASKPNYTLAGDATPNSRIAPTKLYPGVRVRRPEIGRLAMLASYFQRQIVIDVVKSSLRTKAQNMNITAQSRGAFYTICFPEWGGKQINQDPTFVAFADPEQIVTNVRQRIDGYSLVALMALGFASTLLILRKLRKHEK